MKSHIDRGSIKREKTDLLSLCLRWLRGLFSSLHRALMRLLRPNRGRRIQISVHPTGDRFSSPLVGVENIRVESLTVDNLMTKVQWRVPRNPAIASEIVFEPPTGIPTFRESISSTPLNEPARSPITDPSSDTKGLERIAPSSDRAIPLIGVEQIPHMQSLTVGNLLETVQWRVPARTSEVAIQAKINWD